MANTRKPKTEEVIADEAVVSEEIVVDEVDISKISPVEKPVVEAPVKKTLRKYAPDDRILCKSVTSGELIYVGVKTKLYYNWMDFGDTCEVEFQDLQALYSMKHRFLTDPLFVIEDEELVSQWKNVLAPIYDKIAMDSIDEIFQLSPKEFKAALVKAPTGVQNAIKTRAVKMIHTQELYDVRVIKAIDEVLGTEFAQLLLG